MIALKDTNLKNKYDELSFGLKLEIEAILSNADIAKEEKVKSLLALAISVDVISGLLDIPLKEVESMQKNNNPGLEKQSTIASSIEEKQIEQKQVEHKKVYMMAPSRAKLPINQNIEEVVDILNEETKKIGMSSIKEAKKQLEKFYNEQQEVFSSFKEEILVEIKELKKTAIDESKTIVKNAHKEAEKIILEAKKKLELEQLESKEEANNIIFEARQEAENFRKEALQEIKKQKSIEVEESKTIIKNAHKEAEKILVEARKKLELEELERKGEAKNIIVEAIKEQQAIMTEESKKIIENAHKEAEKILSEGKENLDLIKSQREGLILDYKNQVLKLEEDIKKVKEDAVNTIVSYKQKKEIANNKFQEFKDKLALEKSNFEKEQKHFFDLQIEQINEMKHKHANELNVIRESFEKEKEALIWQNSDILFALKEEHKKKLSEKDIELGRLLNQKEELILQSQVELIKKREDLENSFNKELEVLKNNYGRRIKEEKDKYDKVFHNIQKKIVDIKEHYENVIKNENSIYEKQLKNISMKKQALVEDAKNLLHTFNTELK